MRKFYLIEIETMLAIHESMNAPEMTNEKVVFEDATYLCFDSSNSTIVECEEVQDFMQRKYKLFGNSLILNVDWVDPTPPINLDKRRAEIWEEIKQHRDHLVQNGGYKVGAHWFHSDTFSRTQQLALVVMGANMPAGVMWKTMDNGYVPMTLTLAGQIFAAAAASDATMFAKASEHKEALDLSSDPDSYKWRIGWPVTYLDDQQS